MVVVRCPPPRKGERLGLVTGQAVQEAPMGANPPIKPSPGFGPSGVTDLGLFGKNPASTPSVPGAVESRRSRGTEPQKSRRRGKSRAHGPARPHFDRVIGLEIFREKSPPTYH